MKQRWQALPHYLLVFALYLGVALLITWPAVLTAGTRFMGSETGDTYEMARNVWWLAHAVQNGLDPFYQSLLGHPDGFPSAVLMTLPLQYFPMAALALVLPLPLTYNLVVWVYLALNGWAMYWLMRDWLADAARVPAFLAGLVFMAFPAIQAHMGEGHAGLIAIWPAPLYLWALFRLMRAERGVWRWVLASACFFYLSTGGHILLSIYVLLPLTGVIGLARLLQRDWAALRRIVVMGAVAVTLMAPVLLPALRESFAETAYTDTTGFVRYSADLLAIVTPSFLNPTVDRLLDYPRRVLGINLVEGAAYVGVGVALLVLVALARVRAARVWLLVAGVAWVLSLGPTLKVFDHPVQLGGQSVSLPFALLQELPGFNLARTPGRFSFTLAIAVAILAGYGAHWLWQTYHAPRPRRWHYGLVAIFAGFIMWEYQVYWPVPTLPAALPQAVHELRDDDTVEAIFNIPQAHLLAAKDGLYLQTAHEQPLIAGQVTRTTPVDPAKLAILEGTLAPALLNEVGASIVILHKARADEIGQFEALYDRANGQLGAPIYEDNRLALYRVPPTDVTSDYFAQYRAGEAVAHDLSGGITLWGYGLFDADAPGITLHWRFDAPLHPNDRRFVHVLDAAGHLIWQDDSPIPPATTQGFYAEYLPLAADLPAGTYRVRVGWYRLDGDMLRPYTDETGQGHIDVGALAVELVVE